MRTLRTLLVLAVCIGLTVGLAMLWSLRTRVGQVESKQINVDVHALAKAPNERKLFEAMCANRTLGKNWCALDFTRLAAHPMTIQGKKLFVLGYVAIDRGNLVLYATESDYALGENGRSLQVMGRRAELEELFAEYGNRYVRIEGTFDSTLSSVQHAGRIGALHPPFHTAPWEARTQREGIDNLAVHISYLSPEKAGVNK